MSKGRELFAGNREPLWTCPICGEKRYSVIGCWGITSHMWNVHGIPGDFKMNGKKVRHGPSNPILFRALKWWRERHPLNDPR